jgi:NAD(P)-dependent dehydrogenase (short-subunit alcohol dehydrogenase family)
MNDLRFDGQVAIITGAGRGLGREYALLLAKRGATVVVNDLGGGLEGDGGSAKPADDVVAEIEAAGGQAIANHASVTDAQAMHGLVDQVVAKFGRIDALVNNAGIRRMGSISESPIEDYRLQMEIAFFGALELTKAAWPHLVQSKGRVVNTVSASMFGLRHYTGYVAAKGAVLALTRTLAVEAADEGIRVNAVAPAAVTRFMRSGGAAKTGGILEWAEQTLDPALVAPVVAFLAHEDCPLNGEVLGAGGGQVGCWKMGETLGIVEPDLTPELVRDRLSKIVDPASFAAYADTMEQSARILPFLNARLAQLP